MDIKELKDIALELMDALAAKSWARSSSSWITQKSRSRQLNRLP